MNKNFNYILFSLSILILSFSIGFLLGIKFEKTQHLIKDNIEIVKTDTITIKKEIIKPVPQLITKFRTDTIITTDVDTVFLPIEQKHYITEIDNDSVKGQIKAVINGYSVSLDSLQYNIHFEQKTLLKRKKWGWNVSLGCGVGYDLRERQFEPVIALTFGFGYTIK